MPKKNVSHRRSQPGNEKHQSNTKTQHLVLEDQHHKEVSTSDNVQVEYDFSKLKKETDEIEVLKNKKFQKREIKSNWEKYQEDIIVNEPEEDLSTTDFNFLLSIASSDCSHFQLSSERNWSKKFSSKVAESKLFSLNLQKLTDGIGCIPFYEQIGLEKDDLCSEDLIKCDNLAESCRIKYLRTTIDKATTLKTTEQSSAAVTVDISSKIEENSEAGEKSEITENQQSAPASSNETMGITKQETQLVSKDEDLEDWLDSVLSD